MPRSIALSISVALTLLAGACSDSNDNPSTNAADDGSDDTGAAGTDAGGGDDNSQPDAGGDDDNSQPDAGDGSSGGEADDVTRYQELVGDVQNAAAEYVTAMSSPDVATEADCFEVHQHYDDQVRPWISEMMQMGDAMDDHMMDYGGGDFADMGCMGAGMMYELDNHHALACSGPDLDTDRNEVQRHVDAILDDCAHARDRCEELTDPDADNPDFGPMMAGCEEWDGCCSGMMHHCCRGMMSWMNPDCCDN